MGIILRRLMGWLKAHVPASVKSRLKQHARRKRIQDIRDVEVRITLQAFKDALSGLGLRDGQALFVHSGADWLRSVEGGPLAILGVLKEIVGANGTLAMPSFPIDGLAVDYLREKTFDLKRSPSKMGLLTELFRRDPNVSRSLHPTHPVCATGAHADYLIKDHHLNPRPFAETSPFARLEELGGKILMIGVDSTFLTHVHVIEDSLGVDFPKSVYLPDAVFVNVQNGEGETQSLVTYVHNPAVSRLKAIPRLENQWIAEGVLIRSAVGHVALRLFDAKGLSESLKKSASQGTTIYG